VSLGSHFESVLTAAAYQLFCSALLQSSYSYSYSILVYCTAFHSTLLYSTLLYSADFQCSISISISIRILIHNLPSSTLLCSTLLYSHLITNRMTSNQTPSSSYKSVSSHYKYIHTDTDSHNHDHHNDGNNINTNINVNNNYLREPLLHNHSVDHSFLLTPPLPLPQHTHTHTHTSTSASTLSIDPLYQTSYHTLRTQDTHYSKYLLLLCICLFTFGSCK
jgi:hypothetical protein